MFRYFISAVAATALFGAANADISNETISAYNTASQSADAATRIAAAKTLAAEAIANPENEQAALLAYEAASQMCRSGDCVSSIAPAKFAATHTDATDRYQVLVDFAHWKNSPKRKERAALDASLAKLVAEEPDSLTVTAFQERYVADLQDRKFNRARTTAAEAATHFAQVQDVIGKIWADAETSAIVAAFNTNPRIKAAEDMLHLKGKIGQKRIGLDEDETPEWLDAAYYRADAWGLAMEAYFLSASKREISKKREQEILALYDMDTASVNQRSSDLRAEEGKKPFCVGSLRQKPKMRYPSGQAMRGQYGALIIGFDFEAGKVINPEILASVPFEGFKEKALKTVSQWTYEVDAEQPVKDCSMNHDSVILPMVFAMH